MKVLILTSQSKPEADSAVYIQSAIASFFETGIEWDRMVVEGLPSAAALNATYDAIVIPQMYGSNFVSMIDDADITIPIFILCSRGSFDTANFGATPGVTTGNPPTTNLTAIADQFVTPSFSTAQYIAFNTATGVLDSPGVSIMDVSATNPLTGSGQTNAGNTVMWRTTRGSGAGNMYISLLVGTTQPSWPILLQAAINNGEFTQAQISSIRKAQVVIDIDHVNGGDGIYGDGFYNTADPTDTTAFDRFMSYIPSGGVSWAGIYNASDSDITRLAGSALLEKLKAESGKRLFYCYHTHHSVRVQPTAGTFPSVTTATDPDTALPITKAKQHTNYLADKALWEAQGLTFHYPGYYNNGAFRWNEDTLALASPDKSVASDPNGAASVNGWGFKIFRTTSTSSRYLPQGSTSRINVRHIQQTPRGILLVSVATMNDSFIYNTAALWRNNMRWFLESMCMGNSLLFHDWNFADPQEPGVGIRQGIECMNQLRDFRLYLKDVACFFANPLESYAGMQTDL